MCRWLITALLAVSLPPVALPQVPTAGVGLATPRFGGGAASANRPFGRFGNHPVYFGYPLFYADYPTRLQAYEPPSPPVVVVQQATNSATTPETTSEPLLIEWRGDHFVRFGGVQFSGQKRDAYPDYSEAPEGSSAPFQAKSVGIAKRPARTAVAKNVVSELPPAVLVYRDGHREEVSDYIIANGILYSHADYWQAGACTKKIQLSVLDLPATVKANRDGGVKFVLPAGPNEVVTRP